jgi:ABC-2 type transport system permease protein
MASATWIERSPWRHRLGTWWTVLRICLAERLVYRGDFALGTLMRFLPIVTQVFLWGAVYEAVRLGGGGTTLGGLTEAEMVAYFLLTMVTRAFSSMPGLASSIARQIRSGEIKKYLIQPIDMIGFLLLSRVAHKLVYYVVAAAPFALVFFLCRGYFAGWPDTHTMAAYLASLVMSFLLGFFLEAALGMIGFWFLEVSSLLFVYMLMSFFLSGHMFPLSLFAAEPWATLVRLIPLQYLAYFPSAVFLGKIQGTDLAWGLLAQSAWLVFFIVLCRVLFHCGVRRYSGFGG